jgi:hypothetical protein
VLCADDLVYAFTEGSIVPMYTGVSKVFIAGNALIGSAGTISAPEIKYKCDDWIADFIKRHCSTPDNHPAAIAKALYDEARATFQGLESGLAKDRGRGYHAPGDRVVSYVISGYASDFTEYFCFEVGIEVNAHGTGFKYLGPLHHTAKFPHLVRFGEDRFLERAMAGLSPEADIGSKAQISALDAIRERMPHLPSDLQMKASFAVGLIKVEAYFNKQKVGRNVNVVAIDRDTRRTDAGTF